MNDYDQAERICFWLAVLFLSAFGWIVWQLINQCR